MAALIGSHGLGPSTELVVSGWAMDKAVDVPFDLIHGAPAFATATHSNARIANHEKCMLTGELGRE